MAELSPEVQKQLEEQKANCPFCKIIKGEIEAKKVYEDELISVILDINPWIKGHCLVMPKEHYPIMPLIPPETFNHMFGVMGRLVKAVKESMISTGSNVFIANGGIAGQQSPHFLVHLFPREEHDKLGDKFVLRGKAALDKKKVEEANNMLSANIPIMMNNHFQRNPVQWNPNEIKTADFLENLEGKKIYEDKKTVVFVPKSPECIGHVVIFSNEEEKEFERLSMESCSHLFYVASYTATAVFEGLKAQGTNIILKTGTSDDNPSGRLEIHVLPRYQDDGLDVLGKPLSEKPNFDEIASKIKDETFMIEHEMKEKKEKVVVDLDNDKEVIKETESVEEIIEEEVRHEIVDEIKEAIERVWDD